MARIPNPCFNCADRYPACHGECEKYQAWKAEQNNISAAKYYERQENKALITVHQNGKKRRSKR